MKKLLLIVVAAFAMTSCSISYKTATTQNIRPILSAAVLSDLDVSNQKITYTYFPTAEVRRGGLNNCINTAISEALMINGGDVLVETQQARVLGGYGKKVRSVTVTGYPATYKNFRSADEETLKNAVLVNGSAPVNVHTQTPKLQIFKK